MNDSKYFFTTPATIKSSSSKKYKTYEVTGYSIEVDEKGHPTQNGFDQTASRMKLYCDTDYESARYLFIDRNGKIIRHLAYSNGVPNSTRPYPGEKELNEIRSYAQKNDCSIVFLHNHPNGYVEPSRADIEMTERMESLLADNSGTRRFAGHIILDTGSDTYGFYDSNFKNWEIRYNGQGYSFDEYYNAIKSGNLKIRHDSDPDRKTIFFRIEDDRTPRFLSEIEKAYSKDEWNKDEWIPLFYFKEYGVLEHLEYIHKNSFKDYDSLDKRIRDTATKTGTTRCFMLPKNYELTVECSRYASKKEQGKDKGIIESVYFANGSDSILKRYKHSIFDGYNTDRMKIIDDSLDFPFGINIKENITKEKDIKSENIITADILQMIASKTTIWGISQQKAESFVNFLSENNISLHYDPDTLNIFADGNISGTQLENKEIITLKDIESFYSNKSVQFQTFKGEPNMKENIEKESVRQNDAGLKASSISETGSSEMDYRVALAHEIKINMPNLSDGERAAAISILEAGAVSMDMKLSDYVKQTFPNGIFGNFQEAELSAHQQGKLINGGVVIDGFGENAKAVIYASRTADFSTWVHEVAHIWQAQLTGKLKQNAEKAFNVEDGDWKNSKYVFADGHEDTCGEAFAYGFEDILKNADSEFNTPEKQKIYKKFASYMSRTYNGLEKNIEINDDIKKVYDAFCLVDDNLLSQAEKAVKLEMNYVPAVTTEHQFASKQMELQYQIVGENSIRSMSKSMERNRILSNLSVAVYLDENRKNLSDASKASRIRIETGWEKDKTGKWKYETDDSVSRIKNGSSFEKLISTNPKLLTKLTEGDKKLTLNDILDSPELFSNFPFMKDINIRFYDDPDTYRALLDSDGIMINTHYLDAVNGEKGLKGILAHEIQHIIQAAEYNQKQDMTGENLELLYMNTMQKMREEGKRFYDYDTNSVDFGIEKYMKDAGEIEARNVARRIAFSDSERRHKTLRSTEEMMNKMQFQEIKQKTKENNNKVLKNNSGYHVSYDDKGNVKDVRYDDLGEDIIHTLASVSYNKNESFREFFNRVTNERYSAEEKEQLDSILEKITGVSDILEPQERVTQIFKNLEEKINGRKFGPEVNGDLLTKSFEQLTEKYNSKDIHPAQKELFRKYFDEKVQEELGNKIHAENQTSDELAKIVQTRFITDDISNRILNGKPLEGKDGDQQIALNSIDNVVKYIQSNPQRFERSEWIYGNDTDKIKQADKERSVEKQKTNYVLDKLAAAGIEVVIDKEVFDRILEEEKILQKMIIDVSDFEKTEKEIQILREANSNLSEENKVLVREQEFLDFQTSLIACKKFIKDLPEHKLPELVYETKNDKGEDIVFIYVVTLHNNELILTTPANTIIYNFEKKTIENNFAFEKFKDSTVKNDYCEMLVKTINHHLGEELGRQRRIFKQLMEENAILSGKSLNELSEEETKELKEKLKEQEYENIEGVFVHKDKKIAVTPDVYISEVQNAKLLVDHNFSVYILPENFAFKRKNEQGQNESYSTPDTLTNNEFLELKVTGKKVGGRFGDSVEQCNNVLIRIKEDISPYNATKRIQEKIRNFPKEKGITVKDGSVFLYFEKTATFIAAEIKNGKITILPNTPDLSDFTESRPAQSNIPQSTPKSSPQAMVQNDNTYGFAYEGKIYLNPDIMNSEVVVHEYTHLWDNYTQRTNPELWEKGKSIFKNTKFWEEVKADPNYADIADNDDLLLSEVHSRICGKMADKVLSRIAEQDGKLTQETVIDWDKETWNYICEEMMEGQAVNYENGLTSKDLSDFLAMPVKDLMHGRNITQYINNDISKSKSAEISEPKISQDTNQDITDPEPSSHSDEKVSDELKFTKTPEFEKPAEDIQVEDFDSSSSKTDPEKEEPVINKRQLSYSDFLIEASKLETPEAYEKFFNENFNFQIANFKPIPPIADNKLQLFIDGKATDKVFNDNIEEKRSWARWCFDKGMAMYVPLPEVVKKNGMEVIKKSISICNNLLNTDITREAEEKEQSQEAAEQKKDNEPGASIIGPQLYAGSEWTEEELKLIRHVEIDKIPAFVKDPYMDDIAVPKFTTSFRDPETGEYTMKEQSGWHFAQKMTGHGAVTAIMLTKINDSGVREFLKIEPTQYEAMINRGKELVQEWSEPRFKNTHLQALYKYENDIGISKHETRTNTCGQYFHNFEALCRGSSDGRPPADNEEQAMKYAKEIYMKMTPQEKRRMHKMEKEFLKAKGYTIEEELMRRFYEVQKERVFSKKELELPGHSDESIVNGISVEDRKIRGELDDVSHTKVGDTVRISLTTKNFNGKELRMPVTDMKVVAANKETNTVCLIDEQKNTRYELPLDKFISHRQEVTRKQNIQQQKDNRQAAKIEARQKKKETEDYSFGI